MLLIYLRVSPSKCLERIARRNRPYEQKIELGFLKALEAGYEQLLRDWDICPAVTLNDFDGLDAKAVDELARQVKYYVSPRISDMSETPLRAGQ